MSVTSAVPQVPGAAEELVVLLDERHEPVGTAAKAGVHTETTPLHLAFSCYITDGSGQLLVTRRAVSKKTWPGVWTNSVCGHPGPGEAMEDAVVRRVRHELGMEISEVTLVLPEFAYRARDATGVVENEVCPVFTAVAASEPRPEPAEVEEWRWAPWADVERVAATAPWMLSPWSVLQLRELTAPA